MADIALEMPQRKTQRSPRLNFDWGRVLTYAVLILGAFLAIAPFAWMVSASLMSVTEIAAGQLVPAEPLFTNFSLAWERANFAQFMWNSIRISAITLVGELLVCIPAAYAFARMQFVGRNTLFGVMLATMMIPAIATLIPNFLTVVWIDRFSVALFGDAGRWLNSWPSLTIPFMASAFSIFLLRQFFAQIPDDFWDAARIDGAGHIRYLLSVVIPLSKAPIVTVITFGFTASWNSLMWPLLVVSTDDWRPVAFGLQKFVSSDAPGDFNLQMAASVIMIVPILALYFLAQRQFTEGISSSGIKG